MRKTRRILTIIALSAIALTVISLIIALLINSLTQHEKSVQKLAHHDTTSYEEPDATSGDFGVKLMRASTISSAYISYLPYDNYINENWIVKKKDFQRSNFEKINDNQKTLSGLVDVARVDFTEAQLNILKQYLATDFNFGITNCASVGIPPVLTIAESAQFWTLTINDCEGVLSYLDTAEISSLRVTWGQDLQKFLFNIVNEDREKQFKTITSTPTKITIDGETKTVDEKHQAKILEELRYVDAPGVAEMGKSAKKYATISFSDGSTVDLYTYIYGNNGERSDIDVCRLTNADGKSQYIALYYSDYTVDDDGAWRSSGNFGSDSPVRKIFDKL